MEHLQRQLPQGLRVRIGHHRPVDGVPALHRRADDQPQPKIIDVFISKLRKKLRMASGGAEFIETIPQRGWILRDITPANAAA